MEKVNFVNGTKVAEAKVTIDGVEYQVTPAQWTGTTPINPTTLNLIQDNIDQAKIENIGTYSGDLNDLVQTCEGFAGSQATNAPRQGYIKVNRLNANYVMQELRSSEIDSKTYRRTMNAGTWAPWKRIDGLDITTGTEFKTGNIIDGKNEYGKRINLGNLPNATTKTVNTSLSGIQLTRPIQAYFIGGIQANIPYDDGTTSKLINIYLNQTGSTITVACTGHDYSSYVGYATLYYTKS